MFSVVGEKAIMEAGKAENMKSNPQVKLINKKMHETTNVPSNELEIKWKIVHFGSNKVPTFLEV